MRAGLIQPESEQKSRIPRIKFRIPKDKFRIHRDCFASLAMTEILEFHIEIPKRVLGDNSKLKIPPHPQPADVKQKTTLILKALFLGLFEIGFLSQL